MIPWRKKKPKSNLFKDSHLAEGMITIFGRMVREELADDPVMMESILAEFQARIGHSPSSALVEKVVAELAKRIDDHQHSLV